MVCILPLGWGSYRKARGGKSCQTGTLYKRGGTLSFDFCSVFSYRFSCYAATQLAKKSYALRFLYFR